MPKRRPRPGPLRNDYDVGPPMLAYYYDAQEDEKIIGWRQLCFSKLGVFTTFEVDELASRRDIDREVVERAIKGGADKRHVLEALL